MKLKLLRKSPLLSIFLHWKLGKNQKRKREPSFEIACGFLPVDSLMSSLKIVYFEHKKTDVSRSWCGISY